MGFFRKSILRLEDFWRFCRQRESCILLLCVDIVVENQPFYRSCSRTMPGLISYIMVTMNRKEAALRCIASIVRQDYPQREMIVIDNGSTDGSLEAIASKYPWIRLISQPSNVGPAAARNLGIKAARGDFLIFVDDDAELRDTSAATQTLRYFAADERVAIVNFAVLNPTLGTHERDAIPRRDKCVFPTPYESAYFCACGFALRRAATAEIGLFWDRLFYYCEELDYAYAVAAKGLKIIHASDIAVLHWRVATGRPGGRRIYFNARNRLLIAARWLPVWTVLSTVVAWWLSLMVVALRYGHFRSLARGIADGLRLLPESLALRDVLPAATLRHLHALSGRRWY